MKQRKNERQLSYVGHVPQFTDEENTGRRSGENGILWDDNDTAELDDEQTTCDWTPEKQFKDMSVYREEWCSWIH